MLTLRGASIDRCFPLSYGFFLPASLTKFVLIMMQFNLRSFGGPEREGRTA